MTSLVRSNSLKRLDNLYANFESDYRRLQSSSSFGSMTSSDWEVYEKLYRTPYAASVRRDHGEVAYFEELRAEAHRVKLEQELKELKAQRWYLVQEKNKTEKSRIKRVARGLWFAIKEAYISPSNI